MVGKRKILCLLSSLTVMELVASTTFARTKEAATGSLTLSVFNSASVPSAVMVQAQERAGRILAQAGIRVEWLNCGTGGPVVPDQFEVPSPCSSITYPSHLSVRIALTGSSRKEDVFGEAFANVHGEGTHLYVYYAHIVGCNASKVLAEGELLGYVIAHEVGHLLLGTNSHGRGGIMQCRWEQAQLRNAAKGYLQFTPRQAFAMRECLSRGRKEQAHRNSVVIQESTSKPGS
jgi:hypothetical protein